MKTTLSFSLFLFLFILSSSLFSQDFTTRSINSEQSGAKIELGMLAPDFSLRSPDKKEYTLNSVKGKYVLMQFWASWCKPCRAENLVILENYTLYKDKSYKEGNGFTVFSVSFDDNLQSWQQAITEDNMLWPYHVSDLKGANSDIAKLYKVKAIPANFLLDGNGIIVAKGFRASELSAILNQYIRN